MPWKDPEIRRMKMREGRARRKAQGHKEWRPSREEQNAYYHRNRETILSQRRVRVAANREAVREYKRAYNAAHREMINAQQRAYRAKNRERVLGQFREWMRNHQEHFAELKRGKAPRRAAILQKWQLCGELCYICGEHLERVDIEMDHVLPRAHEGTNDIENLMPTHKRCNRRKNKRLDYPIVRFDLVQIATVIKSAPRSIRRVRELEEAA